HELVNELAFSVFGEPLFSDLPGFVLVFPRDDSHSDAEVDAFASSLSITFFGWLRVLHRCRPKNFGSVEPGLRGSRDEQAWEKYRRQRWRHFQFVYFVELALIGYWRRASQQLLDDHRVLDEPSISLVVGSHVVQGNKVIFEATSNHV